MGWRPQETQIERLRASIALDPRGARPAIEQALGEDAYRRSDRVRLWGLLVAASTTLGDLTAAEVALRSGKRIRTRDRTATAEILGQEARYHGVAGRYAQAYETALRALQILQPEMARPPGTTPASRRRYRFRQDLWASLLFISGDVARFCDRRAEALARGLQALDSARSASTPWRAAVSLLGVLVADGAGNHDDLRAVLQAVHSAFAERLPRLHVIKLHWVRALILARVGLHRWAESIMDNVVAELTRMGADADLAHALEHLVWIVAERAAQPARAMYLLHDRGGALDAATRARLAAKVQASIPPALPRVPGW